MVVHRLCTTDNRLINEHTCHSRQKTPSPFLTSQYCQTNHASWTPMNTSRHLARVMWPQELGHYSHTIHLIGRFNLDTWSYNLISNNTLFHTILDRNIFSVVWNLSGKQWQPFITYTWAFDSVDKMAKGLWQWVFEFRDWQANNT